MLEIHESASVADERRVLSTDAGLVEKASAAFGILHRQKWIIGSCAVLGLLVGGVLLQVTPPVYVAQTELLFDRGNRPVLTQQPVLTEAPFDTSFFESQTQIFHSDKIALAVVRKLNLAKDPEFISGGILNSLMNYVLSAPSATPEMLEELAAGRLTAKLEAKRVGLTFFVEVSFKSNNPATAEHVLQAVIDEYVAGQQVARIEAARTASRWLEQRLDELRRKATLDEQAVNTYKAKNQIVSATGGLIGDQSLAALNSEIVSARAKASDARARLDRIDAILRANDTNIGVDATVSDALTSPIITKLRQDYLMLEAKEVEYALRYGKGHLAVVGIRGKINSIQQSIRSELRRLAENSKSEYVIAENRLENLERELSSSVIQSQATNRAQVALRDLESAAQNSRSLYNLFQARLLESAQQQSMSMSDVQQTGPIGVNKEKRGLKIGGLALAAGLAVGASIGFLREALNRVLRTSKQAEQLLGLPCVALVPILSGKNDAPPSDLAPRTLPPLPALETIARARFAPFTEAVRCIKLASDLTLKSSIDENSSTRKGVIIGMTSSVPNEGKSTIAISLGQMAASTGRRAIVIDCDLRNPSLSRSLSPDAATGLLDVLSKRASLQDAMWVEPSTNLAFLPAIGAHACDPAEVLASRSMTAFVDSLRALFDYVIVDFSPIAPAAELSATASLVDGYIFVVEWGRTRVEVIQRALGSAPEVYEKIIGVALNKADMDDVRRYDSYDYNKYNYK